jgi:hypothetical protein
MACVAWVACGGEVVVFEDAPEAGLRDASTDATVMSSETGMAEESGLDGPEEATVNDVTDVAITDTANDIPDGEVDELPSTAPCLVGGNVFWLDAEPGALGWTTGGQTLTSSSGWAVGAYADVRTYDGVLIEVHPAGSMLGAPFWYLDLDTSQIMQVIETGMTYENAHPSGTGGVPDVPGLTLGYKDTCGSGIGSFRIDTLSAEGDASVDTLLEVTVAFAAHCDGWPGVIKGCVHYGP